MDLCYSLLKHSLTDRDTRSCAVAVLCHIIEKQPLGLKPAKQEVRLCLLPPPSSLFLLTSVTDIPNSWCPTYCFAFAIPARLPACLRRMSLEVMTILCRCENIETSEGVPLDVTGVAQVMHFKRPGKKSSGWWWRPKEDPGKWFN